MVKPGGWVRAMSIAFAPKHASNFTASDIAESCSASRVDGKREFACQRHLEPGGSIFSRTARRDVDDAATGVAGQPVYESGKRARRSQARAAPRSAKSATPGPVGPKAKALTPRHSAKLFLSSPIPVPEGSEVAVEFDQLPSIQGTVVAATIAVGSDNSVRIPPIGIVDRHDGEGKA
ncbi:hypothetical protein [Mesorhizobium sp. 113-3-3]|uniref:hypothetical protein n=1 Tax=Mesorhizobium sp. 113-3-3 TaxID=2744516 RepID=UPI0019296577|nr:hypothetical protein [Mesorhizobium sp. 113-3-3]BCG83570.1 hypothetical protein MesoLj113b_71120 [Mesorhizobium sp. 113-3-3]